MTDSQGSARDINGYLCAVWHASSHDPRVASRDGVSNPTIDSILGINNRRPVYLWDAQRPDINSNPSLVRESPTSKPRHLRVTSVRVIS